MEALLALFVQSSLLAPTKNPQKSQKSMEKSPLINNVMIS